MRSLALSALSAEEAAQMEVEVLQTEEIEIMPVKGKADRQTMLDLNRSSMRMSILPQQRPALQAVNLTAVEIPAKPKNQMALDLNRSSLKMSIVQRKADLQV